MKAYVATTGVIFALIFAIHIWRLVDEGWELAQEPAFIISSLLSIGLCIWAWRVHRALKK
jgi:hypothetical protein